MKTKQKGVGLIEVLVALLLLAIGILGFVALQIRAVEGASEATKRIQGMNLARDLAEKIRINTVSPSTYQSNVQTIRNGTNLTRSTACFLNSCTPSEKVNFDLNQNIMDARDLGMDLNIIQCPNIQNQRMCIYVAWDRTVAEHNISNEGTVPCTVGNDNDVVINYHPESTCIVLETY